MCACLVTCRPHKHWKLDRFLPRKSSSSSSFSSRLGERGARVSAHHGSLSRCFRTWVHQWEAYRAVTSHTALAIAEKSRWREKEIVAWLCANVSLVPGPTFIFTFHLHSQNYTGAETLFFCCWGRGSTVVMVTKDVTCMHVSACVPFSIPMM